MRKLKPPFKFDFRTQFKGVRRNINTRVGSVSINLPFLSFSLNPDDLERRVAKEIVIRMADRRVLNAFECCDNCIDRALSSLQEVRRILVDKQVELSGFPDSPLYLLIELQVEAIRQFLTFEQRLDQNTDGEAYINTHSDFRRSPHTREQYFAGLEMLRAHLHRCLFQISKIAEIKIPKITDQMRYDEAWQLDAYENITEQ
ncbi:MAG: hypothetical protein KME36_00175 [Candidatus Thiodiazotropha sp. (ex Lucina pensylvanica)]|nr:hypothetical protein [Candidatus Thiodiazotropha sp. (ex Lucina pensylvanica)]MBT3052425.1 hypothetical protein [Candidatus Thiodiazotropha sp. (ex Codakia orbicularis)]